MAEQSVVEDDDEDDERRPATVERIEGIVDRESARVHHGVSEWLRAHGDSKQIDTLQDDGDDSYYQGW